jgi:hypothetical protein
MRLLPAKCFEQPSWRSARSCAISGFSCRRQDRSCAPGSRGSSRSAPPRHHQCGTRLKNDRSCRAARPLPENHLASGQETDGDDGVVEAGHAIDMGADPLPGQIFVGHHLVRRAAGKARRRQPLLQRPEPVGQGSEIGMRRDRPFPGVIAVSEVLHPAFELQTPFPAIQMADQRRLLGRGKKPGRQTAPGGKPAEVSLNKAPISWPPASSGETHRSQTHRPRRWRLTHRPWSSHENSPDNRNSRTDR